MKSFDYQKEALRTLSPSFYGDRVHKAVINEAVTQAIEAGSALDALKRILFYGKGGEPIRNKQHVLPRLTKQQIDLLHAAIGMVTEAAEFLDAVWRNVYHRKPLDVVNAKEELGDSEWYPAVAREALGLTQDEVQRTNIEKLRTRYPDKFSQDAAIHRDLNAERAALKAV